MALQRFRKEFGRSPTQEERKEISEGQDPLDWTLRQPPNIPQMPDRDQEVQASEGALTDAEWLAKELARNPAAQRDRAEAAMPDGMEFEAARIARQKQVDEEVKVWLEEQRARQRMYQEQQRRADEESFRAVAEERKRKKDERIYRQQLEDQERRHRHRVEQPPTVPTAQSASLGEPQSEEQMSRDEIELLIRRCFKERNEAPTARPQELRRHRYHRVEIEKFTGDIEKYPAFRQTITYIVGRERFEDERDKAMLLLRHLSGEVRIQVDYLSRNLTNETFAVMLGYLDRTYGDSEVTDLRAMRSLDHLPRLTPFNRETMIRLESTINAAKAALVRKTPGALEDPYNEKFQRIYQALAETDQRSFTNFCQNRGGKTNLQNLLDYIGVHVEADKILALSRKRPEKTLDQPDRGERLSDRLGDRLSDPQTRRATANPRRIESPIYSTDDSSGTDSGEEGKDYQSVLNTAEARGSTTGAKPHPGPLAETMGARPSCLCCENKHPLHRCRKFAGKNLGDRLAFIYKHRLCSRCLRSGHRVQDCGTQIRCGEGGCQGKHHRLLHVPEAFRRLAIHGVRGDTSLDEEVSQAPNESEGSHLPLILKNRRTGPSTSIQTAVVFVRKGRHLVKTMCVLDSAAACSTIDADFARSLKLKLGKPENKTLVYVDRKVNIKTHSCHARVVGQDRKTTFTVNFETAEGFSKHCNLYPWPDLLRRHPHLSDIRTPFSPIPSEGTMLIGADNPHLLEVLEYRKSVLPGRPVGLRTVLGWAFMGPDPWNRAGLEEGEPVMSVPATSYKASQLPKGRDRDPVPKKKLSKKRNSDPVPKEEGRDPVPKERDKDPVPKKKDKDPVSKVKDKDPVLKEKDRDPVPKKKDQYPVPRRKDENFIPAAVLKTGRAAGEKTSLDRMREKIRNKKATGEPVEVPDIKLMKEPPNCKGEGCAGQLRPPDRPTKKPRSKRCPSDQVDEEGAIATPVAEATDTYVRTSAPTREDRPSRKPPYGNSSPLMDTDSCSETEEDYQPQELSCCQTPEWHKIMMTQILAERAEIRLTKGAICGPRGVDPQGRVGDPSPVFRSPGPREPSQDPGDPQERTPWQEGCGRQKPDR